MEDERPSGIRRLPGPSADVVFVCRKCSKKLGGGFGLDGRDRLATALRRELGAKGRVKLKKGRARAAVLETGCLGLCPKGAVVAVRPGPTGSVLLVRAGSAAAAVAEALGLAP